MNQHPLCHVAGLGQALPGAPISNAELIRRYGLESTPEWIETRTGIRQRFFVGPGETTATLAAAAAQQALVQAKLAPSQVGAVVVATCTPDYTFPSVATLVQAALGLPVGIPALDVNAACSGFIAALSVAQGWFATQPGLEAVLVIGAETFSNVLDFTDRSTCVLFGDGAGAMVLRRNRPGQTNGLLALAQGADGRQAGLLHSAHGVARGRVAGTVQMDGAAVFKHAVRQMGDQAQVAALLAQSGHTLADLAWLVPHQANARILAAAGEALGLAAERVVMTVAEHANTSAASIPLALATAQQQGQFQPGELVLLQAFGAGFTWGMASLRW
ncbi:MAG: beta-ketoacyl-ACP synthase 3 [Alphaproteobacteria bacterium]|jgi:3-oxoacyl-[acyl-carrier-protein] synthase-3|nr:beta-ketoacyl-ACP synthase 3 [Alphaproteobacteria bacterium]